MSQPELTLLTHHLRHEIGIKKLFFLKNNLEKRIRVK